MKNTITISAIVEAMVTKGVMRVDAETYVTKLIEWMDNFGESEENVIKDFSSDMENIEFIYHHTDKAGMQCLAARAAHLSGWSEEEIAELVNAVGEVDFARTTTCDILSLCGFEGEEMTVCSKVFAPMCLTSINVGN